MRLHNPFRRRLDATSALIDMASDAWAIDASRLEPILAAIRKCVLEADVTAKREAEQADDDHEILKIENGVAHVSVDGVLLERGAALFRYFGFAATDYPEIRKALKRSEKDDVETVVLHVNSPGGMVTGLQATASHLFSLRKQKAVHAHVEGMAASAAYWLGSQAGDMTAEEGAEVGSIGVYAVVEDSSQMFEDAGIKVHVLRSGEHKGVGEPGAPITKKQLDKLQKKVDQSAAEFVTAVSRGRDMTQSEVGKLATGEVWSAKDALDLRLIDGVETIDTEENTNDAPDGAEPEEDRMSNEKAVDMAAIEAMLDARLQKRDEEHAKEKESLRAALDQTTAQLAEQNAKIEGLKSDQKAAALDRACADGRVLPAERETFEAMAKTLEPEAFAEHLGRLTPRVHRDPDGAPPADPNASAPTSAWDERATKVRRAFGLNGEDSVFRRAKAVDAYGNFVLEDGSAVDVNGKAVN